MAMVPDITAPDESQPSLRDQVNILYYMLLYSSKVYVLNTSSIIIIYSIAYSSK